jgi:CRP/FNR family transcriptional regulator, cyclic AMP receptor protein
MLRSTRTRQGIEGMLGAGGDLDDAMSKSSLGELPREVLYRLCDGAALREIAAGTTTHRGGEPAFLELVISGLFRGYVIAPDGRTMTIRYCRPGALMGAGTVFNLERTAHASLSAVTDSRVLVMRPERIRKAAGDDIRVTMALLGETSARVAEYINEFQLSAMAPVRQRLARHLLDLASESQTGPRLVVRASQERLAASIGTVREIIVRILADMRDQGLVRTGRGQVELLDPARLDAEILARFTRVSET